MTRALHDLGNGTFDADRLLLARVEAMHAAVTLETEILGAAGRHVASGVGMTHALADQVRTDVLYRAGVLERWLLRSDED